MNPSENIRDRLRSFSYAEIGVWNWDCLCRVGKTVTRATPVKIELNKDGDKMGPVGNGGKINTRKKGGWGKAGYIQVCRRKNEVER